MRSVRYSAFTFAAPRRSANAKTAAAISPHHVTLSHVRIAAAIISSTIDATKVTKVSVRCLRKTATDRASERRSRRSAYS